jgi:hypothetical protein
MEESNGLDLDREPAAADKSIAPRRTSKRDLTSPVCDAIFFVNRVRDGIGRNALAAPPKISSSNSGAKRTFRIPSNCSGEYGEKCNVFTLALSSWEEYDVRV